jgi:hypothetical protein
MLEIYRDRSLVYVALRDLAFGIENFPGSRKQRQLVSGPEVPRPINIAVEEEGTCSSHIVLAM